MAPPSLLVEEVNEHLDYVTFFLKFSRLLMESGDMIDVAPCPDIPHGRNTRPLLVNKIVNLLPEPYEILRYP